MASSSAEYYRGCAKDCCRKAVIAEDIDQRTYWLEAAARWVSLARQEGFFAASSNQGRTFKRSSLARAPCRWLLAKFANLQM